MRIQLKTSNNEPLEIACDRLVFSGGEVQVRLHDLPATADGVTITQLIHDSNQFMELLLVTNALREKYGPDFPVDLVCPYLPYARQDRVCYPGEAFSLKLACGLINAQGYRSVTLFDVHSKVAMGLLDRCFNLTPAVLLERYFSELEATDHRNGTNRRRNMAIVSPDKGAVARASEVSKKYDLELVMAEKVRDPNNGKIVSTRVNSEHLESREVLIIDDICDGGRTFIELAAELKKITTGRIGLYVTHGIFSKGFEVFRGLIDEILTVNLFPAAAEARKNPHPADPVVTIVLPPAN
jgi:ribose-phosphate pyrophosphokinase